MFNNYKNDPLVEAVKQAQKDGEYRRQAEALVNEAFGVYSRKALVLEDIAAYDAALEEAYGELKEGTQIDEVSRKTLKSYVKKATTSADRAWAKADKEEDKAMSTDGMKYPEKQNRHHANAAKAIDVWRKRDSGIKLATKKLKEGSAYDGKNPFDPKDGSVQRGSSEVSDSKAEPYDRTLPKVFPGAASSEPTAQRLRNAGGLKEEQLDEISKELAGNYIKRATQVKGGYDFRRGMIRGKQKSKIKLSKSDRERNYDLAVKTDNRHTGIITATNKLTGKAKVNANEETQLDELKRTTLVSYIRKASASKATPNNIAKRGRGMELAAKKMEKERSETRDSRLDEGKIDPVHAKEILDKHDAHGDFHALSSSTVSSLVDTAKKLKYRKGASAPGSTGRMFHQHLKRAAAKVVKEEQIDERYHVVTSNYSLEPGKVGQRTSEDEVHSKHKSLKAAARKLTTVIGNNKGASKYEILDTQTGKRMSRDQARSLAEETLEEAVSRKHFQQVADLIKSHESQDKRNELASHHAEIFAKQNPRFSHERFHAAAGSTALQQKKVNEGTKIVSKGYGKVEVVRSGKKLKAFKDPRDAKVFVGTPKKTVKEDSSFNSALETGKSVSEQVVDMAPPPALHGPAVAGQTMKQAPRPTNISFSRGASQQGVNVRPNVSTSGKFSMQQGMSSAGRLANATRPTVPPPPVTAGERAVSAATAMGRARGLSLIGAARGAAVGGITGAAVSAAAEPLSKMMQQSHQTGHSATPGVSKHPTTPGVNNSEVMARMRKIEAPNARPASPSKELNPATSGKPTLMSNYNDKVQPDATKFTSDKPAAKPSVAQSFSQAYRAAREAGGSKAQFNWTDKSGKTGTYQAAKNKSEYVAPSKQTKVDVTPKDQTVAKPTPTVAAPAPKPEPKIVPTNQDTPKPMITNFTPAAPQGDMPKMSDQAPKLDTSPAKAEPKMNGPSWADQEKAIKNTPAPSTYVPDAAKVGRSASLGSTPTVQSKGFVKESPVTPGSTIDDPNDTKRSGKTPGTYETSPGIAGGSTGPDNAETLSKSTPSKLKESVTVGNYKYRII